MLSLRFIVAVAPVVALVGGGLPRAARACQPDPCQSSNRWADFGVASTVIAPDGVLRLRAERNGGPATVEEILPYVSLEVTDEAGGAIEGALEYDDDFHAYLWRPAVELAPQTGYDVALVVDNDALAAALDEEWIASETWCGENIDAAASFQTSATPLGPLALPMVEHSSTLDVRPVQQLDTLVCCDGAYPQYQLDCAFDDVSWTEGTCSATIGTGTVTAQMGLPADRIAPEVATDLAVRMVQTDGTQIRYAGGASLSTSMSAPEVFCAQLEIVDLAHGELVIGPGYCYGEEDIDELGLHEIDPSPGLVACAGQPYTCEIVDEAWDPRACEPWGEPPGEDESGSAGDSGGSTGDAEGSGGRGSGASDDGDGDTDGGGTSPQDDAINDRGCACRASTGGGGPAGLWLLVLGVAWRGTRRARRCG